MAELNLYKERKVHTVTLEWEGNEREFRIPSEYTVEEIERIFEAQKKVDERKDLEGTEDNVNLFWDAIFEQLLVLFEHYHSDITLADLKKNLTRDDAVKILRFYSDTRLAEISEAAEGNEKKKARKSG